MESLQELIKENKSVANLWNEYLMLYNYVDDKMVEGCDVAEKLLNKINEQNYGKEKRSYETGLERHI